VCHWGTACNEKQNPPRPVAQSGQRIHELLRSDPSSSQVLDSHLYSIEATGSYFNGVWHKSSTVKQLLGHQENPPSKGPSRGVRWAPVHTVEGNLPTEQRQHHDPLGAYIAPCVLDMCWKGIQGHVVPTRRTDGLVAHLHTRRFGDAVEYQRKGVVCVCRNLDAACWGVVVEGLGGPCCFHEFTVLRAAGCDWSSSAA